jgi:hypothetical protein
MPDHYRAARLLACSLALADYRRWPGERGVMDRAIHLAIEAGAFPVWFRSDVSFSESWFCGTVCNELRDIERWALLGELIEFTPGYPSWVVTVSPRIAARLLPDGISPADARRWGVRLAEAIEATEAAVDRA